ncbi:hypothetical protein [Tellurirhabdus bombi]|uniref:hypothetical protein n=1 Tax=Tellurirhabdus bombi TaxID=2907205 RepID=UPI001F3DBF25|nr:hypothetical protein [Tellurirhabdus bombi]
MSLFAEQIVSQLSLEGIKLERLLSNKRTPFALFQLVNSSLVLHFIDLDTYTVFQSEQDVRFFFQQLSEAFSQEGKRLIHLWEDVWRQKPAVVQSRLRALAGQSERIPARLTKARRIDRPTAEAFLEKSHLQAPVTAKYKYGLFLPARYFRVLSASAQAELVSEGITELLVAVATFSYPRQVVRDGTPYRSVELVRFANQLNSTVIGGLDKLLKAFLLDRQTNGSVFDDVMTYADRDWSDGGSYEKLGFTRLELTEPQPFWLHPNEAIRYYPHRLPAGLAETELLLHGYVPVYNAGSIKFVKMLA